MNISNEVLKDWNNTILNVGGGNYSAMEDFKKLYPQECKFLNSMLLKRSSIRRNVKAMRTMSDYVYWGTLTYENEYNEMLESTKRKQALTFLNEYFSLWLCVEEYGTKSGRYHIHFLAVNKQDFFIDYDTMRERWHSFLEIERIPKWKQERKIKYLTNYVTKNVPRIRRNKRLIALEKDYSRMIKLQKLDFHYYDTEYYRNNMDILHTPF